jgi:alkanesulfonate monooxygenase SsuD/methylene tetrahydromethanopterin reductase-like flavin-dependent oxidoreductase (luciferase family)
MPDYGRPLRFAAFIPPANSPTHRPVESAQLSERLGFDFVTFQDHPCEAGFHDTWTLLSWAAARTERIGLSGL